MKELIKRQKKEAISLNIITIIVVIITIILNSDNYKQIFTEKNLITDKESLYNAIDNGKRFVTLDLTKAKLTRFSIKNNTTNEIESNAYEIIYDDETLIMFLKENTVTTDRVKGELITPSGEELEIKNQLEKETTDIKISTKCFSNVDYMITEKITRYKFIISIIVIALMIIISFLDLIYYFNPEKAHKYKKYLKKEQKAKSK